MLLEFSGLAVVELLIMFFFGCILFCLISLLLQPPGSNLKEMNLVVVIKSNIYDHGIMLIIIIIIK